MHQSSRTNAAVASLCILSGLAMPSLTGCATSQQGPRVQGIAVPEGYTVNDRGQFVPEERLERALATKNLAAAGQQLLLTAAILDTALDESNVEQLSGAQDRLLTQRLLVEGLRYRATRLSARVAELAPNEQFVPEPLRSECLIMQNVANTAAGLGGAVLQRYFPNLSVQAFAGAPVRELEAIDSSQVGGDIASLERAVVRTMLLTRGQSALRNDSVGLERGLRESEFTLYQAVLQMVGSDLKIERQNPGSISPESAFAATALGQVAAWELNRMQESNPTVIALSSALSPDGARSLFSGGMTDAGFARFNRFMAAEFPNSWNSLSPGIQVESYLKISQRPISARTYRGTEVPAFESTIVPTEAERQAFTETMKRFTFQEEVKVATAP